MVCGSGPHKKNMKIKRQNNDVCHHCQAPQHCFVAAMAVEGQNSLAQEKILLKKGEILYHQQEKFNGLYLLKTGVIKTSWLNVQGDQQIGEFYLPGELLGFSSLNAQQYMENAQALQDAELCRISLSLLMRRLQEDLNHQTIWLNLLSASLSRAEKARYRYINASGAQKVALFLMDYMQRLVEIDMNEANFQLLPTQQDIANYLGLTAETISRILAQFQRQGLIQSSPVKRMTSLAYKKLQALVINDQKLHPK